MTPKDAKHLTYICIINYFTQHKRNALRLCSLPRLNFYLCTKKREEQEIYLQIRNYVHSVLAIHCDMGYGFCATKTLKLLTNIYI